MAESKNGAQNHSLAAARNLYCQYPEFGAPLCWANRILPHAGSLLAAASPLVSPFRSEAAVSALIPSLSSEGKALKRAEEVVMPLASLKEYLDKNGVKYVVVSHSPAFTAQGIAVLAHIPGKELAKTVVVKVDGELALAVLPASLQVNLALLKDDIDAKKVQLASEDEFKNQFPECETGAMPPFGNLYGMKVFADENLARDREIAFNACSHRELIRLAWEDFARLARPKVIRFTGSRSAEAA